MRYNLLLMDNIRHSATVEKIENGQYIIKIVSLSACASCHAKSACPTSDKKDKYIEIPINKCRELAIGESVNVIISQENGQTAFIIAYTIPVIIIVLTVIILKLTNTAQGVSAIIILAVIATYFIGLYTLRGKLEKKIKIKVE